MVTAPAGIEVSRTARNASARGKRFRRTVRKTCNRLASRAWPEILSICATVAEGCHETLLSAADTFTQKGQSRRLGCFDKLSVSSDLPATIVIARRYAACLRRLGFKENVLMSNRLALAVLALACMTAAAGGGYLATRQNAVPVPAAAQAAPPAASSADGASTPAPSAAP